MTQREKKLATGLVVVLGVAASAGLLYFFALEPYKAAKEDAQSAEMRLADERGKLAAEQSQIAGIFKVNPRLNLWHEISLRPAVKPKNRQLSEEDKKRHVTQLQVEYEKYLHDMMQRNRFQQVVVTPGQVERPATAKGKQPTFERVAFRVTGRGELSSVTGVMEEFHKAPLLHQIRGATVELANQKGNAKAAEGELDLKMTVEALVVTGAKDRATLLPAKLTYPLRVMADPPRNYYLLSQKNMFTGIKPPPKPPKETPKRDPKDVEAEKEKNRKREKPQDVLRFVKLTMLCYNPDRDRWEATVYDQAKGGSEKKLTTSRAFNDLTIFDRYEQTSLDAKVVYIDERQLIFKDGKKYHRMLCGDFVWPAMQQPLTERELKELGIAID